MFLFFWFLLLQALLAATVVESGWTRTKRNICVWIQPFLIKSYRKVFRSGAAGSGCDSEQNKQDINCHVPLLRARSTHDVHSVSWQCVVMEGSGSSLVASAKCIKLFNTFHNCVCVVLFAALTFLFSIFYLLCAAPAAGVTFVALHLDVGFIVLFWQSASQYYSVFEFIVLLYMHNAHSCFQTESLPTLPPLHLYLSLIQSEFPFMRRVHRTSE